MQIHICLQAYKGITSLRILLSTIGYFYDMNEGTSPEDNLFYSLGYIPLNILSIAFSVQEHTVKSVMVINEFQSSHIFFFFRLFHDAVSS
jgi:hypothetical protein